VGKRENKKKDTSGLGRDAKEVGGLGQAPSRVKTPPQRELEEGTVSSSREGENTRMPTYLYS